MPFFRSIAAQPITFDAGDTRYIVPPGGVCELDRRVAYVPKARGLPLVAVERSDVRDEPVVDGAPVPPPRKVRVRGVASGETVLQSDDGDDRVGDALSEHRSDLQALSAVPEEGDAAEPQAMDPAVIAALASRRERKGK